MFSPPGKIVSLLLNLPLKYPRCAKKNRFQDKTRAAESLNNFTSPTPEIKMFESDKEKL